MSAYAGAPYAADLAADAEGFTVGGFDSGDFGGITAPGVAPAGVIGGFDSGDFGGITAPGRVIGGFYSGTFGGFRRRPIRVYRLRSAPGSPAFGGLHRSALEGVQPRIRVSLAAPRGAAAIVRNGGYVPPYAVQPGDRAPYRITSPRYAVQVVRYPSGALGWCTHADADAITEFFVEDDDTTFEALIGACSVPPVPVAQVISTDPTWKAGPFLDNAWARTWLDQLNDTGTASISVANDEHVDPHATYEDILLFQIDDAPVFASLVEKMDTVTIAAGEEAAQSTVISGRGVLALLDDVTVYPEGGALTQPVSDTRLFFYGSRGYDTGLWSPATVMARFRDHTPNWNGDKGAKAPAGFPDPAAGYIWNDEGNVNDAPQGTVYFRRAFAVSGPGQAVCYASGDNLWDLYLDGVPILTGQGDGTTWLTTARSGVFPISAGVHVLAARVTNTAPFDFGDGTFGANPAFLIASLYSVNTSDGTETLVLSTDDEWRVTGYLDRAPPVTPGTIVRRLLLEGFARGCLIPVVTFTDTTDSDGFAWTTRVPGVLPMAEFPAPIGDSVLAVVRTLAETYVDVALRPGAFILDMWDKGSHLPYTDAHLRHGYDGDPNANLTELHHTGVG